jgi:molecular chaperone GrpE (heat shock protein)
VEKQPAEKPSTFSNHQKDSGGDSLLVAARTPEREKKKLKEKDCEHPLSQLDELEAELEDLRKQIDRETEDARRIREEVMGPTQIQAYGM